MIVSNKESNKKFAMDSLYMLIIFTESVLLYHFKGFILEIKTRQYKRKEVRVVLLQYVEN